MARTFGGRAADRVVELFVDGSIPLHVGESVEVAVQLAQCGSDSPARTLRAVAVRHVVPERDVKLLGAANFVTNPRCRWYDGTPGGPTRVRRRAAGRCQL